jgi:lipoprotein NlpI
VADFDRFVQILPEQEPQHWQRGIALYYAGEYDRGRKQFESHQKVNTNDVENAVWHFICVARSQGVDKAKAALIPIEGDRRVPMKEIHALFAGKAKAADVLAAADDRGELFYAHLYLGLYYDAHGDKAKTREHIDKAANEFAMNHYMGDVARVHAALLKKAQ